MRRTPHSCSRATRKSLVVSAMPLIRNHMAYHSTAMPRKADDMQRVLNAFRNLVKALRLADRAGLKRRGLGAAQTFVLHELSRDAPLSINELAERTATDQSTVSVVVHKLV